MNTNTNTNISANNNEPRYSLKVKNNHHNMNNIDNIDNMNKSTHINSNMMIKSTIVTSKNNNINHNISNILNATKPCAVN